MGYFPFANSCFQMGVTVMGFAEDFGLNGLSFCHRSTLFTLIQLVCASALGYLPPNDIGEQTCAY